MSHSFKNNFRLTQKNRAHKHALFCFYSYLLKYDTTSSLINIYDIDDHACLHILIG